MPVSRTRAAESGQVILLFALLIPVIFGLGAIVLDIGNWYVHKRHLQTQVDAAVLAAGPAFVGCFHSPSAANAAIAQAASAYAGDTLRDVSTSNKQVQQPNDVRVALNSSRYWQKSDGVSSPSTGYGLDNSMAVPGDPCSTKMLDAKATDDDAPPLWGLIPFTPSPKTHAKVEIRKLEAESGMLPWAVPEIDPRSVWALYVNEDTGIVFDRQELVAGDDPNLPWSEWETRFDGVNELIQLGVDHDNTGVVILVSKDDPNPVVTGGLAAICSQSPKLVNCYAGSTATSGATFIHGYNGGGSGGPRLQNPIVRQVELGGIGCDPQLDLSAPYFTLSDTCTATISAVLDFGVTGATNPKLTPNCVTVTASPGGELVWSGNEAGGSRFVGSFNLAPGRTTVNLSWVSTPRNTNCNQTTASGSFTKVAAPYMANIASGPVQYLKLNAWYATGAQAGFPVPDANSVDRGEDYNYKVTVGLPRPIQVLPATAKPLVLRLANPSGSQNQAIDCDKNINYADEITNGCKTTYRVNYDDLDGDGDLEWRNIQCNGYSTGNLPPTNYVNNPIPDCAMTETGDKTGPMRQGLAARFESPCLPNYWPAPTASQTEIDDFFEKHDFSNDPRYVTLIITDNTAFTGSGNEPVPIKYFAGFYVTGWDVGGATNGCPDPDGPGGPLRGNECHPVLGCSYQPSKDNGDAWGHFVNIVVFSSTGDPDQNLCTFGEDPAVCLPVLVE